MFKCETSYLWQINAAPESNAPLFLKAVKNRKCCGKIKLFRVRDPVADPRYLDWCSALVFSFRVDNA
jgi:hypothetical protein